MPGGDCLQDHTFGIVDARLGDLDGNPGTVLRLLGPRGELLSLAVLNPLVENKKKPT